ncbi:MAG: hypothetical protein ABJE10_14405 [bacterium]
MTEQTTIATFTPHLGDTFRMVVNDEWEIHMVLVEAEALDADSRSVREPFSLIFRAPPQAVVAQQLFRLEHDDIEPFEIFLVPLGPDELGMRYQAVFN